MKKLIAALLVIGGVAMFVSGCATAPEHPTAEHPAKPAAPKDHPAH
jgi:hypothetical protein